VDISYLLVVFRKREGRVGKDEGRAEEGKLFI
jgi:hypothetical protein